MFAFGFCYDSAILAEPGMESPVNYGLFFCVKIIVNSLLRRLYKEMHLYLQCDTLAVGLIIRAAGIDM